MPYLSDADILIGLNKVKAIVSESSGSSIYKKFNAAVDAMIKKFSFGLKNARAAERSWHEEVEETQELFQPAMHAYIKWRQMVLLELPGAHLVDWEMSDATPDEIELALENIISMIEDNAGRLDFSAEALEELTGIVKGLDKELNEDRESYRKYRNLIDEKNKDKEDARSLFHKIRRFIRYDKGADSVEYGQLKDRAVRKARKEEMPPVVLPEG